MECHRLAPQDACVCLQAAQLCYEQLQLYQQGLEWSQRAAGCVGSDHQLSRAHMAQGMGLCLVAKDSKLLHEREELNDKALQSFKK